MGGEALQVSEALIHEDRTKLLQLQIAMRCQMCCAKKWSKGLIVVQGRVYRGRGVNTVGVRQLESHHWYGAVGDDCFEDVVLECALR